MSIPMDYHIHTPYCGHAYGEIIEYVEHAIAAGLKEIGFSDHLGRYYLTPSQLKKNWEWGMREELVPKYFGDVSDLQKLFDGHIRIRIGLEVDFIEGAQNTASKILDSLPFDFAICSIHCLPSLGWKHLARYTEISPATVYKEYFKAAEAAVVSDRFQSLAHLDFLWRYVDCTTNELKSIALKGIEQTVKAASKSQTALEINSNGFHHALIDPVGTELFGFFLDQISIHKPSVTIGSDAHEPKNVAWLFEDLAAILKTKGITSILGFEQKQSVVFEI
ncbi:MAG: histidinol-phosphatase [Chitinispirillales bacterium]|jgi:histidinol-phosphatase (PHP family)|nr:histidinol-phosphatase [Chitinispirillales bacterium]